jgi:predicted tellurium resistance membrane protein TerC
VLFWGIMGAIVFRIAMLGGGVWLATRFDWIFYVFGAYLAWQGLKLGHESLQDEEEEAESEDDPYQESDEALPDDAEERVINRNPSREGGTFDEV